MLPDSIKSLILEEQARQSNRFVEGVDLDEYLVQLGERAEILSDSVEGRCRGLVAFYCNDLATKQAFVTLVLVNPLDRGLGLGAALLSCVLSMARSRGFTTCRLEVARENEAAQALYRSLGFRPVGERSGKDLLEVAT